MISVAGGAKFNVPASGFTVGSGQTLTGAGLIAGGPVTVAGGGTLAPGPVTGIGSLTISNSLTLNAGSTNYFALNKAANTNDSLQGLSSVGYNGTLQVNNLTGTLTNGDAFKLFYSPSYAGAFASLSPPTPSPGLRWSTNTLAVDGTLRITNAPVPRIAQLVWVGNNLVLGVTNGSPGFTAYVQAATNLASPQNWVLMSTNLFDGSGNLLWTNLIKPGVPAIFFRLEAP